MSKDQYQSITSHIRTKNPQLVYSYCYNIKELKLLKTKKIKWVKENITKNNLLKIKNCTVCWLTKNHK